ncbi:MAG: hypothetical protein JSR44_11110 [Spirochaetes bacterium]|nr:hypothetical protein [Spirochaetota bacterium]
MLLITSCKTAQVDEQPQAAPVADAAASADAEAWAQADKGRIKNIFELKDSFTDPAVRETAEAYFTGELDRAIKNFAKSKNVPYDVFDLRVCANDATGKLVCPGKLYEVFSFMALANATVKKWRSDVAVAQSGSYTIVKVKSGMTSGRPERVVGVQQDDFYFLRDGENLILDKIKNVTHPKSSGGEWEIMQAIIERPRADEYAQLLDFAYIDKLRLSDTFMFEYCKSAGGDYTFSPDGKVKFNDYDMDGDYGRFSGAWVYDGSMIKIKWKPARKRVRAAANLIVYFGPDASSKGRTVCLEETKETNPQIGPTCGEEHTFWTNCQ